MKQVLVILAVVAASSAFQGGLRVRFGGLGSDYFVKLPLTVGEAHGQNWVETARPDGPLPSLRLLCHDSRVVCVLYDDTDNVAGLQVAFAADEITETLFDWEVQGYSRWTPSYDGKQYWAIQQYYVTEDYLATSKEQRVASRVSDRILQLDGIWVTGINKELVRISKKREDIHNSAFTEQACIPMMGRHYYYNMTANMECTSETMFPWFPLVHSGELVATGLVGFGKIPEKDLDWFERPPQLAVKVIVPRGPECLYELADNPGLITMHIYYVDKPVLLQCFRQ